MVFCFPSFLNFQTISQLWFLPLYTLTMKIGVSLCYAACITWKLTAISWITGIIHPFHGALSPSLIRINTSHFFTPILPVASGLLVVGQTLRARHGFIRVMLAGLRDQIYHTWLAISARWSSRWTTRVSTCWSGGRRSSPQEMPASKCFARDRMTSSADMELGRSGPSKSMLSLSFKIVRR